MRSSELQQDEFGGATAHSVRRCAVGLTGSLSIGDCFWPLPTGNAVPPDPTKATQPTARIVQAVHVGGAIWNGRATPGADDSLIR
jgi:hypothetical protein